MSELEEFALKWPEFLKENDIQKSLFDEINKQQAEIAKESQESISKLERFKNKLNPQEYFLVSDHLHNALSVLKQLVTFSRSNSSNQVRAYEERFIKREIQRRRYGDQTLIYAEIIDTTTGKRIQDWVRPDQFRNPIIIGIWGDNKDFEQSDDTRIANYEQPPFYRRGEYHNCNSCPHKHLDNYVLRCRLYGHKIHNDSLCDSHPKLRITREEGLRQSGMNEEEIAKLKSSWEYQPKTYNINPSQYGKYYEDSNFEQSDDTRIANYEQPPFYREAGSYSCNSCPFRRLDGSVLRCSLFDHAIELNRVCDKHPRDPWPTEKFLREQNGFTDEQINDLRTNWGKYENETFSDFDRDEVKTIIPILERLMGKVRQHMQSKFIEDYDFNESEGGVTFSGNLRIGFYYEYYLKFTVTYNGKTFSGSSGFKYTEDFVNSMIRKLTGENFRIRYTPNQPTYVDPAFKQFSWDDFKLKKAQ